METSPPRRTSTNMDPCRITAVSCAGPPHHINRSHHVKLQRSGSSLDYCLVKNIEISIFFKIEKKNKKRMIWLLHRKSKSDKPLQWRSVLIGRRRRRDTTDILDTPADLTFRKVPVAVTYWLTNSVDLSRPETPSAQPHLRRLVHDGLGLRVQEGHVSVDHALPQRAAHVRDGDCLSLQHRRLRRADSQSQSSSHKPAHTLDRD